MSDYLIFKLERFRPEGGQHVANQVKYWCEILPPPGETALMTQTKILNGELPEYCRHPFTDDNPHRLISKISRFYKKGDTIKTLSAPEITATINDLEHRCDPEVELREPLSHDELRILSIQVLEEITAKYRSEIEAKK